MSWTFISAGPKTVAQNKTIIASFENSSTDKLNCRQSVLALFLGVKGLEVYYLLLFPYWQRLILFHLIGHLEFI